MFFLISAIFHYFLFFPPNVINTPNEQTQQQSGGKKKNEIQVKLIPKSNGSGKKMCPRTYNGIGVTRQSVGEFDEHPHVIEVAEGYPAYRAGIKVGDVLLNWYQLVGDKGTPVVVKIMRDGVYMEFNTIREEICSSEIGK